MVGLHIVRKMKSGVSGFRALSRRWISSETCVIRGACQDITFPSSLFESLDDHQARFRLVQQIRHGELIEVDPTQPNLINDHWRRILFSGFLHSYICKSENDCIANAFNYENVGVLKGLNLLAFKKFDRVEGKKNSDHMEYSAFVKNIFRRFCDSSPLLLFQQCADFVAACEIGDDNVLRYHSFFLEDEELANLYTDTRRLLRQEFKHRGLGPQAKNILTELDTCYSNTTVVRECERHLVLQHLLGSHCPEQTTQGSLQGGAVSSFPGTALVDIHQIAVQHVIEDNVLNPAFRMHPKQWNLLNTYSRVDLIRTLRYMFPMYPGKILVLFKANRVLHHLQMARRLPTPSIYYYVSPPVIDNCSSPPGRWSRRSH
ncbi:hypothetical protein SEVIR_2G188000v4 [Setaria viridis]